jgi:hypothetical protein
MPRGEVERLSPEAISPECLEEKVHPANLALTEFSEVHVQNAA